MEGAQVLVEWARDEEAVAIGVFEHEEGAPRLNGGGLRYFDLLRLQCLVGLV